MLERHSQQPIDSLSAVGAVVSIVFVSTLTARFRASSRDMFALHSVFSNEEAAWLIAPIAVAFQPP